MQTLNASLLALAYILRIDLVKSAPELIQLNDDFQVVLIFAISSQFHRMR